MLCTKGCTSAHHPAVAGRSSIQSSSEYVLMNTNPIGMHVAFAREGRERRMASLLRPSANARNTWRTFIELLAAQGQHVQRPPAPAPWRVSPESRHIPHCPQGTLVLRPRQRSECDAAAFKCHNCQPLT